MRATEAHTLRDLLRQAARWYPDNEAAVDLGQRLTYRQLMGKVRQMAAMYHSLGVRKGDRVAFMAYPSVNHAVAALGAIELGAIPAALHVRESVTTLAGALKRLSPRVLVYDGAFDTTVDQLRAAVPFITGYVRTRSDLTEPAKAAAGPDLLVPDDLERFDIEIEPMAVSPSDIAVIVLSSGSTGVPKAVCHSHDAMLQFARNTASLVALTAADPMVNMMSTSFIGWYGTTLALMHAGAKVVYRGRFDPETYLDTIADEGVTVLGGVPTMLRMLMRQAQGTRKLDKVRMTGFGGETMDMPTLLHIRERIGPRVLNSYGTTETCSPVTAMYDHDMVREGKLSSIGKPCPGYDIRVIRSGGGVDDEVAPGTLGEIIISGPSLATQMWDDPATTRRVFEGKWWHSGDLGRLDEDGFLYLEGRVDDMIISGGINVFPARIEDVLMAHPGVAEVAVVGVPHEVWGQQIQAVVVRRHPTLTEEELEAYVRASDLANYQRPRRYIFMDALPRTSSGKISRKTLRDEQVAALQAAAETAGDDAPAERAGRSRARKTAARRQ